MNLNRTLIWSSAAIAVAAACIAIAPILGAKELRPSALVRMTSQDPIARAALEVDSNFVLYPSDHYDGIYMYAIARDPFLRGEEHKLIDLPGARYGHPLFGWMAGLLSLGDPARIPLAMLVINLLSIGGAAALASTIAQRFGFSGWGGLVIALNPGLIYAVTVDTSEVLGILILCATVLAWLQRRWTLAGVLAFVLCFAKEPYALVPASFIVWEVLRYLRARQPADLIRRVVPFIWGPIGFVVWELYLRGALGYWAFKDSLEVFRFPLAGWTETLRMAVAAGDTGDFFATQLAAVTIPLLAAVLVALVAGAVRAARLRGPLDVLFLALVLLHLCLTWRNLLYPKDLIRQFATVFVMLPLVLAGYQRGPHDRSSPVTSAD